MKIDKTKAMTELIVEEFQFEWPIEKFSSIQKIKGERITSPEFEIEMDGEIIKWTIRLYPNGHSSEESKDHVSVFLCLNSADKEFVANHHIFLFNTLGKEIVNKAAITRHYVLNQGWGWRKLILRQDLLQQLPDDKLTIVCKLNVCLNTHNSTYLLPVPQLQSSIIEDMNRANTNMFSDVTISVCGTDFEAHKIILAARSPVFSSMFKNEMSESKSNKVEITDLKPEVFAQFLAYIYTGKVDDEDIAGEILAAAEKYDVRDLKSWCEDILGRETTVENCLETLSLSDLYSAENLKKQTMEFFVTHADKFDTPDKSLTELKVSNSCMSEIIKAFVNRRKSETDIPIAEFTFEWTVKNISFSHEETRITSPPLSCEKFEKERWAIELIPKKKNEEDKENYLSIYLKLLSTNRKAAVQSKFSFSLQNIYGKEIAAFTSDSYQVFSTQGSSIYGKENLILTSSYFYLIPDDTLKIIVSSEKS